MTQHVSHLIAAALLALSASAAGAQAPAPPGGGFRLPADCRLNEDCWIANYFDVVQGPNEADFRCLSRTYDGHDGTDIAIRDRKEMARGVAVLAGAPGLVVATRDGEVDGAYAKDGRPAVRGRECGNGVVIDYGGGWTGQLCHMRHGSLRVQKGDRVDAQTQLGMVGMSGMAAFPHVHWTLRRDNVAIDPFTARPAAGECTGEAAARSLWHPVERVSYAPFSIYAGGFAARQPTSVEVFNDAQGADALPAASPAIGIWAAIFGVRDGDKIMMQILDPAGATFLQAHDVVPRARAQHIPYAARRKPDGRDWPRGRYRGQITLERLVDGQPVRQTRDMTVEVR